jgi:hypothetical protein
VQIEIIASVDMVSSHIPKYPITIKEQTVPDTTNQLLEPIQAIIAITSIIMGQGALINNFSNHTRKYSNGSKKDSIPSPYVREKSLKLISTYFLKSRNS